MKEKNLITYIVALLSFVFGVYFIISPEQSIANIAFFLGLIVMISGLLKIVYFLKDKESSILVRSYLLNGIINFIFGIIIMLNKNTAIKVIPVIIGFWLTLKGASNLLIMASYKRIISIEVLVKDILTLIVGVIILTTPIISIIFTGWVLGIILILVSIYLVIDDIKNKNNYSVKIK